MEVIGYSERGAVSSLFYEIAFSSDPDFLLAELMGQARFPFKEERPPSGSTAVLLEQSFSQFGSADALILYRDSPCSVFVEAKVKTWSAKEWSIQREFDKFTTGLEGKVSSSNLFTQLYHKFRLVEALRQDPKQVQDGVQFPEWSVRRVRKIGTNPVVRRAVEHVQHCLDEVFYLALVPDQPNLVEKFFNSVLVERHTSGFLEWDLSTFGYLTWEQVERFCIEHNLERTLAVLEFNRDQIH